MTILGEFALWIALPVSAWGMILGYAGGRTQRGDLVLSAERSIYAVFGLLVAGPLFAKATSAKIAASALGVYGILFHGLIITVFTGMIAAYA